MQGKLPPNCESVAAAEPCPMKEGADVMIGADDVDATGVAVPTWCSDWLLQILTLSS